MHHPCSSMGYSRKNPHTPTMGSFFNPPSHLDFLKHKTPPPVWISKTKDPPSCLDFQEKNVRLKFNLVLMEISTITSRRCSFLISQASAKLYQKFYHMELRNEWSKDAKKRTSFYILSCPFSFFALNMVLK